MSHAPGPGVPAPNGSGPLAGVTVIELAGIGPAPYGAMLLADLGAEVIRVDRPGGQAGNPLAPEKDLLNRGKVSVELDLKNPADVAGALALVRDADALIEGFRPGVAERLGLGPDVCLAANPALVYGRMTGWGQDGPFAHLPGHDINYIGLTGLLHPIGPAAAPAVPLNVIGDFGGGGMLLALGVVTALLHARTTGRGQVVDAAITDGTASLSTMLHALRADGQWHDERESNLLDGGAHFYRIYETADGRHLSVGAVEPQFYRAFLEGLGVPADTDWVAAHRDPALWAGKAEEVAAIVRTRSLAEWEEVFHDSAACVHPVLTPGEAARHPHHRARGTFLTVDGVVQPRPAPRFSGTPLATPRRPPRSDEHGEVLRQRARERLSPGERPRSG
ncbi:CaiB/BaiF CoA transferase family protein [Streptomyces sp. NPDC055078]